MAFFHDQVARVRRSAARRFLLVCGGLALAASGLPAQATSTIFTYQISGNFSKNSGPDQQGRFAGTAKWNTALNSGAGGWSEWDFDFYSKSNSVTPIYNMSSAAGGCFVSPVASLGNGGTGQYSETPAGGLACTGTNSPVDSGLPSQTFLSIYSTVPYTWTPASSPVTANFNYFRLKFVPDPLNPLALVSVPLNAQTGSGLGWSAMTADTVDGTCTGTNSFPTSLQNCPYSGNTQNYQGISGTAQVVVTAYDGGTNPNPPEPPVPVAEPDDVPAPLPLLGASAALAWSRRLRRRTRSRSAV